MNQAFAFLEYHQASVNQGAGSGIATGDLPEEWLRIYFKSYPRFKEIPLPSPQIRSGLGLGEIMRMRCSSTDYSSEFPTTIEELSTVLSGLMVTRQRQDELYESRRPYPSAGARYPIEAYVLPFNVAGLEQRVHHYSPRGHTLERLWKFSPEQLSECFPNDSWCCESGVAIILTACFLRTAVKYQERAYRFCSLEAGHAAQNVCLLATSAGLASCAYGGYVDEAVMRLVDINPNEEIPLHVLFVGKLSTNRV
jgi:SagB-type dehydrogenase family enzyme